MWKILEEKRSCTIRPAAIHQCAGDSRIFCNNMNIVYWTSYLDIYLHLHMHQQTRESSLLLVLTLFPLLSPYARRFSEQTDEKNPCWAVFVVSAILNIMLNACVLQLGFVSCTDFWAHEEDTRRFVLCNVSYRDIVSGIVSWKNVSLQAPIRFCKGCCFYNKGIWQWICQF